VKWKDHKRITKYAAKALGLDGDLAQRLAEASILPDISPDREISAYITRKGKVKVKNHRIQHHSFTAKSWIWKYLYRARKQYLKGDPRWIESLGRALHYIQDYSVSRDTTVLKVLKIRDWKKHDLIENNLSKYSIPKEVIYEVTRLEVHANMLKFAVSLLAPEGDEEQVIKSAAYFSALTVKGVLFPSMPQNLEENFKKALKRHLGLVGVPLGFSLLFLIFGMAGYFIALLGLVGLLHLLDSKFHYWNLERQWFNL